MTENFRNWQGYNLQEILCIAGRKENWIIILEKNIAKSNQVENAYNLLPTNSIAKWSKETSQLYIRKALLVIVKK